LPWSVVVSFFSFLMEMDWSSFSYEIPLTVLATILISERSKATYLRRAVRKALGQSLSNLEVVNLGWLFMQPDNWHAFDISRHGSADSSLDWSSAVLFRLASSKMYLDGPWVLGLFSWFW
jgi:hypothetical protein